MKKQENLTKQEKKQILEIAMRYILAMQERGDFEYRMNDEEDFLEVSIGSLEGSLEAAYLLGKQNATKA